jgi:hypothetical protein
MSSYSSTSFNPATVSDSFVQKSEATKDSTGVGLFGECSAVLYHQL